MESLSPYLPFIPVVAIAILWVPMTSLVTWASGWTALSRRYPDRAEMPSLTLRWLSGEMGAMRMRGVLILSACPSGMRVDMFRPFHPLGKAFFVPWNEISVERLEARFFPMAKLRFGDVERPLSISASVADRLAQASAGRWPAARP